MHKNNFSPINLRGITLIEVMVAMVLSAILVLVLTATWAMVGEEFFKLTLKQKAIFILNGEMERLVAAFRYSTNGNWFVPNENYRDPSTGEYKNPSLRNIYIRQAPGALGLVYNTNNNILEMANSQIFPFTANGTDYNIVWLDRDRAITAVLSWDFATPVGTPVGNGNVNCQWQSLSNNNDQPCYLLIVYLQYPFRFNNSNSNPLTAMGQTTEISLQTIIGGVQ